MVWSGPPKLHLVDHSFVVVERAFGPVLAPDLGHRHPSHDGVDSGANIDIRTIRHERDLIAGRELIIDQ